MSDEAQELRELLAMLREHGVTRYRDGDVEIELRPAPRPNGLVTPEALARWIPAAPPDGEFFATERSAPDQRPPSPPLPDEQPAVEIDYEALARQEQERRQKRDGAGS